MLRGWRSVSMVLVLWSALFSNEDVSGGWFPGRRHVVIHLFYYLLRWVVNGDLSERQDAGEGLSTLLSSHSALPLQLAAALNNAIYQLLDQPSHASHISLMHCSRFPFAFQFIFVVNARVRVFTRTVPAKNVINHERTRRCSSHVNSSSNLCPTRAFGILF